MKPELPRFVLKPLSLLYGLLATLHRSLYMLGLRPRAQLPGKTLSIGNLAAGGTGKSPVTMRLAELLLDAGARPVILTRGYGVPLQRGDSVVLLSGEVLMPARSTQRIPDEARMQSALLPTVPVIAGPDRYAAARRYLREASSAPKPLSVMKTKPSSHSNLKGSVVPTHWLLDDGFQHWPLARDFDLVLLDAADPLPELLPLGLAREAPRALQRADMLLFTRCREGQPSVEQIATVQGHLRDGVPVVLSSMQTEAPLLSVEGGLRFDAGQHLPACLVSGVGQPEALLKAVKEDLGYEVGAELRGSDHSPIDRLELLAVCKGQHSILTTAKDYWRDPSVFASLPLPVFVLPLRLRWPEAEVRRMISQFL